MCNLIEHTIIQQINTAVDSDCLADLIDDDTGLLKGPVPHIMKKLFKTYGAITPQTLTAVKATLEATTYNHTKPIMNIFTAINDYANMAKAAEAAKTQAQLINIGLIIITRSTIFSSDIRKWNSRPEDDKTWPTFKTHFKEAQCEIKRSQPATTTDSLGFHGQANAIVDQVIERLSAEQHMQQEIEQEMANATQQESMIDQMQSLTATISDLQTQGNSNSNSNSNSNYQSSGNYNGRRGNRGGRGRGHGRTGETRQQKYCWTHGNCLHSDTKCESKAAGHIDGATYENRQNGSDARCNGAGS
jgi:hypothetical protein